VTITDGTTRALVRDHAQTPLMQLLPVERLRENAA